MRNEYYRGPRCWRGGDQHLIPEDLNPADFPLPHHGLATDQTHTNTAFRHGIKPQSA
jgi:hypothetical protein